MTRAQAPPVLTTARLVLRRLASRDASFVLELVNDAQWLANIGDRGVRDLAGARAWIANGPGASFATHGFGLMACDLRDGGATIGICGLVRRAGLDGVDLGYALLPAYRRQGYATEAARATLAWAGDVLALPRLLAIVTPRNAASVAVLKRCGFAFEREVTLSGAVQPVALYAIDFAAQAGRQAGPSGANDL